MLPKEALFTYIALRGVLAYDLSTEYISLNRLAFILLGNAEPNYYSTLSVPLNQGLCLLDGLGLISIKATLSSSEYIIDISNLALDTKTQFFIKISQTELTRIICSDQRIDASMQILRYFLCMIGNLNHSKALGKFQGKIGEMSVKNISSDANVSIRSATRYNTLLKNQKLIYIYHSPTKQTNTYSRYQDMPLCIEYGKNKSRKDTTST